MQFSLVWQCYCSGQAAQPWPLQMARTALGLVQCVEMRSSKILISVVRNPYRQLQTLYWNTLEHTVVSSAHSITTKQCPELNGIYPRLQ